LSVSAFYFVVVVVVVVIAADDDAQTTFEKLAFPSIVVYLLLLCLNGHAIADVLTGPRCV